jgi:hypothetical protein
MDLITGYLSAFFKEKKEVFEQGDPTGQSALRQAQGDSQAGLGKMVHPAAMDQYCFCGMFNCGNSPDSS